MRQIQVQVREEVADARFTFLPRGVVPIETPLAEIQRTGREVAERPGGTATAGLESAVREAMVRRVRSEMPGVTPFVSVTVLPGPDARAGGGR